MILKNDAKDHLNAYNIIWHHIRDILSSYPSYLGCFKDIFAYNVTAYLGCPNDIDIIYNDILIIKCKKSFPYSGAIFLKAIYIIKISFQIPMKKPKTNNTELHAFKWNKTIDLLLSGKDLVEDGSEASSILSTNTFKSLFHSQSAITIYFEDRNKITYFLLEIQWWLSRYIIFIIF